MAILKSSSENLTLNADGSGNDIKFQSNGVEKASLTDGGVFTATSFVGSGANLTGVGVDGIVSNANATAMTITDAEKIGIGETAPLGQLHIKNGDSGQGSVNSAGESLVIESNGSTGITFLSGSSSNTSIIMGDSESNYQGVIIYDHSVNAFKFATVGTERMRIDSSGKVGIGTTSPLTNSLLHIRASASSGVSAINNGLLLVENSTGVGIGLLSNNDRQQTIAFGDPEDNDVGFINYGHDTNQMSFNVNASERLRITDNGITFNGDTASANSLDDYEEGTWTMTLVGGSTPSGQSPPSCRYVKVGNMVTCYGMWWGVSISGSATAGMGGLPFTSKTGTYITGVTGANTIVEYGGAMWGYSHSNIYLVNNHTMAEGTNRSGWPRYLSFSITYQTN